MCTLNYGVFQNYKCQLKKSSLIYCTLKKELIPSPCPPPILSEMHLLVLESCESKPNEILHGRQLKRYDSQAFQTYPGIFKNIDLHSAVRKKLHTCERFERLPHNLEMWVVVLFIRDVHRQQVGEQLLMGAKRKPPFPFCVTAAVSKLLQWLCTMARQFTSSRGLSISRTLPTACSCLSP